MRRRRLTKTFERIHHGNEWLGAVSVSGPGSDPDQTRAIRSGLRPLLDALGCRSLLDVPCGDWAWMRDVNLSGIDYHGWDVVPAIINANRAKFATPNVHFEIGDLTRHTPPAADVVLVRDLLVHLPDATIRRALKRLRQSGCTYLLTTTFTAERPHLDMHLGGWRPLCLTAAPWRFPEPLMLLDEECTSNGGIWADKALGAWRMNDVPV
jgi:hypothetical protein